MIENFADHKDVEIIPGEPFIVGTFVNEDGPECLEMHKEVVADYFEVVVT